jgi:hypothetical protein
MEEKEAAMALVELMESHKKSKLSSKIYYVEKILGHRIEHNGSTRFLVKWKGYDSSYNTYEPIESFKLKNGNYNSLLIEYCETH